MTRLHAPGAKFIDGQSPAMLTIAQVEEVLQVSRWKVYRLMQSGELESIKIGRSRRIPVVAVQAYVAKQAQETV
jgi:excisionase family DNA binding protein